MTFSFFFYQNLAGCSELGWARPKFCASLYQTTACQRIHLSSQVSNYFIWYTIIHFLLAKQRSLYISHQFLPHNFKSVSYILSFLILTSFTYDRDNLLNIVSFVAKIFWNFSYYYFQMIIVEFGEYFTTIKHGTTLYPTNSFLHLSWTRRHKKGRRQHQNRKTNRRNIKRNKTGVINDPLGQTHSLTISEHCFRFVLFC